MTFARRHGMRDRRHLDRALTPAEVDAYHQDRPGITEELLALLADDRGRTPYDWLLDGLPSGEGPVLDLACGSAPLASALADQGYVGVDRSAAELARARQRATDAGGRAPSTMVSPTVLVRADLTALPLRGPFAAAVASMALMLVPLEPVLAEVARVLAPGGVLSATVPTLTATGDGDGRLHRQLLDALGRGGVGYPEPLDPGTLSARLAGAGLRLHADEFRRFVLRVGDPAGADLLARSYYALSPETQDRSAAVALVEARRVEAGRDGVLEVGYGLRRLVARRC